MRASEFITEADLDEGWKSGLAALGVAGGLAMGGFGSKNKDISYDITPGVQPTQSIQKVQPQAQSQAQPQVQQPTQQVRTPSTPEELKTYLVQHATNAGMSGAELQHFISQMSHETRNFTSMIERGTPEYFKNRYEKNKNKAKILGNKVKGDGERFKGRGYIQLTGRDNYTRVGRAIGVDLANNPDLAAQPEIAAKVAEWFWKNRVAPKVKDFEKATVKQVTKGINPNMAGLKHRQTQLAKVQTPEEAVGVIANASQKNDPRYSSSLTGDIHPDTTAKNMKALRLT
jgi:putative chitinase